MMIAYMRWGKWSDFVDLVPKNSYNIIFFDDIKS